MCTLTHTRSQTTKPFRQKHLHPSRCRVTLLPLMCHTRLRAFFCRTTRSSSSLFVCTVCVCVLQKMSQRCHKGFSCCVLEKFLQVQCFVFFLWQKCSFEARSEKTFERRSKWRKTWSEKGNVKNQECVAYSIKVCENEWRSSKVKKNESVRNGKRRGGRVAKETPWVSRCSDSRG